MGDAMMRMLLCVGAVLAGCVQDTGPVDDEEENCGPRPERAGCIEGEDTCALDARDSDCGGEIWECSGGWQMIGVCDPGFLHVVGDLDLTISVEANDDPACPATLRAPVPYVLTVAEDGTITGPDPTTVIEATIDTTVRPATADLQLTSAWFDDQQPEPVAVSLQFRLTLDDDGVIQGDGSTVFDGDCTYPLFLAGFYEPVWRLGG